MTDHRRVLTMVATDTDDLYRFGVHAGNEPYPGIGNTDATKGHPEYRAWGRRGQPVPKIVLDDGSVLWGPECWWRDCLAEEQEAALLQRGALEEREAAP